MKCTTCGEQIDSDDEEQIMLLDLEAELQAPICGACATTYGYRGNSVRLSHPTKSRRPEAVKDALKLERQRTPTCPLCGAAISEQQWQDAYFCDECLKDIPF